MRVLLLLLLFSTTALAEYIEEYRGTLKIGTSPHIHTVEIMSGGTAVTTITSDGLSDERILYDDNQLSMYMGFQAGGKTTGTTPAAFPGNAGFGYHALRDYLGNAGGDNSAFGVNTLRTCTTCSACTALGADALAAMSDGEENTAVGDAALNRNVNGDYNTAVGSSALLNSENSFNTAVGRNAAAALTSGASNTVVGNGALAAATSTNQSVAIGASALIVSTGNNNIGVGVSAGTLQTSGDNNLLVGHLTGGNLTTGSKNIVLGHNNNVPTATASNQLVIGNAIYGTGLDGTGDTISGAKIGILDKTPASELTVAGDIEATGSSNGIILESPDGSRSRCTVDNSDNLTCTGL